MATFQKIIRPDMGAALPGTLVEAANTYRYIVKGVAEDATCKVGGFVAKNKANGKYHATKASDETVAGIVLNDQFYTGETIGDLTLPANSELRIVENGVVAYEIPSGATYTDNEVHVLLDKTNGKISIEAPTAITGQKVDTGWRVVQAAPKPFPSIAFLKK